MLGPVRLRPDNFTPPSRTPWGGRRILDHYKAGLALSEAKRDYDKVGESWEISVDPAFVSACETADGSPLALDALLRQHPLEFLGEGCVRKYGPSTPLLLKLLDAADALSVQVHPSDDYAELAPHESGKPEAWLILDCAPGAGIYLGLAEGVSPPQLAEALQGGADLRPMLNFVPTVAGDAFVIDAGVVHAIGAGVTLLEPQLCYPGRSGKTYRFWDYERRYDPRGQLDPHGTPRPLHVEDSLRVTRFEGPRGEDFVRSVRFAPQPLEQRGGVQRRLVLRVRELELELLRGQGRITLSTDAGMLGVLALEGAATVSGVELRRGQACVVPAACSELEFGLEQAELAVCRLRL